MDGAEAGLTTALPGLAPGQRYRLSFLQSGDTFVYAYLTITRTAGRVTTQSLPSAPATDGAWSRYSDAFLTPADTRSVTVTIATSGAGTIALDSVSLTALANQVPATFAAGTVSLTFDDGDASVYTNGWPAMRSYGFRGTFYLNAATLNSTGFLTSAQVRALATAGNEIGSHLYHHSDLVQLDSATLADELSGNAAALHRIVGANTPVTAFASPFGSYTSGALDTVMRYASSHRTSDGAMNTKADLDPRTVHAELVTSSMTAAALGALVQQAKDEPQLAGARLPQHRRDRRVPAGRRGRLHGHAGGLQGAAGGDCQKRCRGAAPDERADDAVGSVIVEDRGDVRDGCPQRLPAMADRVLLLATVVRRWCGRGRPGRRSGRSRNRCHRAARGSAGPASGRRRRPRRVPRRSRPRTRRPRRAARPGCRPAARGPARGWPGRRRADRSTAPTAHRACR